MDPLDYIGALRTSLAQAGADSGILQTLDDLRTNYSRKWWHEVSEGLIAALHHPLVRAAAYDVYKGIALPIRLEMSGSNYVKILYTTIQAIGTTEEGEQQSFELLDSATNCMVSAGTPQAVRCIQCIRALLLMTRSASLDGKRLIDEAGDFLATLQPHQVEPVFQALLTKARCRLHELNGDFSAFYESVFLMLAYADKGHLLSNDEYAVIAYKTALAALLSTNVHSFGKLLTTASVVESLEKGNDAWLLQIVRLCNVGDVTGLETYLKENAASVQGCPELNAALPHLLKKVRLMALLHLVFNTRADNRVFTFQQLATRCSVSIDGVELLLLSAMALHLIEGSVDGLTSTVEIRWLQPRVVDTADIRALAQRVKEWRVVTADTSAKLAEMAKEVPN